MYAALRTGLRDYTDKNGFERVVFGLSGRHRLRAGGAAGRGRARARAGDLRDHALALLLARDPADAARDRRATSGVELIELAIEEPMRAYERAAERAVRGHASPTSPRRTSRRASAATW